MAVMTGHTFDRIIRAHLQAIADVAPDASALPIFGSAAEIRAGLNEDYIDDGWGSFGDDTHQERRARAQQLDDEQLVAEFGTMEPLGCGSYGCVYQTSSPRWVFKVTTDASEAHLVAIMETLPRLAGMAAYHGVRLVPRQPRPTYILWREAATVIGLDAVAAWAAEHPRYGISPFAMGDTELLLYAALTIGRDMFSIAEQWAASGKSHLVTRAYQLFQHRATAPAGSGKLGSYMGLLQAYEQTAHKMTHDPLLRLVGQTLLDLLQRGITLNDLHANNVGLTARSTPFLVITDPGHVIPLDDRYQGIAPRSL